MSAASEPESRDDAAAIEREARELLDALDRMHGRTHLSLNVRRARDTLRQRFPTLSYDDLDLDLDRTTERP